MNRSRKGIFYILAGLFFSAVTSCGIYSFSGVSIGPDVKTFQVDYFMNNAPLVNPTLSNTFTIALQDILQNRTRCNLVNEGGDLVFEGEITRYDQTSIAPTIGTDGTVTASKVRLTIAVKVRFYNNKDETQNFDKTFSQFDDMEGTETLNGTQEQELVDRIIERLVTDIFNQSVAQW